MSRVDPSTFSWVKSEIDESLKQTRLALETYARNTDDTSQLRMGLAFLHQVSGTLQIVELDGAARLANEVEQVCEGLIDEKIPPVEDSLEILSRGVLSLTTYIARLHAGYPDSIVALTPLINEMRSLHDADPVSEFDLFNPDLDIYPDKDMSQGNRLSDEDFAVEVAHARKQLVAAMVTMFRQPDSKQPVQTISLLFSHLKKISRFDASAQIWWIGHALTEARMQGGLEAGVDVRRLFAGLEQELKHVIEDGESKLVKSPSEELLRRMLYHIGKASSNGAIVNQVKEAFDLDELVGGEHLESMGEIFEATSPEVLQSVMKAMGEEVAEARRVMDEYVDEDKPNATSLEPVITSLDKIRGAVDVINKPRLQALVEELTHACLAYESGAISSGGQLSMEMASGILSLETACTELDNPASNWEESVDIAARDLHRFRTGDTQFKSVQADGYDLDEEGTLTDVEYSQLVKVVAQEIATNLASVVERFEQFSKNVHLPEFLKILPEKMSQIQGALEILERKRAIELMALINEQITNMSEGRFKPSTEQVETTALAITAIEAYVENLQHERPVNDLMLERAMESLLLVAPSSITDKATALSRVRNIRDGADDWLRNPEDPLHLANLKKDMAAIIAIARRYKNDNLEKIAAEVSRLVSMLSEDPELLTDDITSTFHQSLSTLEGLVSDLPEDGSEIVEETTAQAVVDEATGLVDLGALKPDIVVEELDAHPDELATAEAAHAEAEAAVEHAEEQAAEEAETRELEEEEHKEAVYDDEILEFFLEEAREIADQSRAMLQNWRSNPADEESLTTLRRCYHTLKGSGRMSGAVDFGEYAWHIEEMLNDVISGKHVASDAIFGILEHAINDLPGFLDDLEQHDESDVDPDRWLAMIEALDSDVGEAVEIVEEAEAEEEAVTETAEEVIEEIALSEALSGLPAPLQSDTVRDIYTSEISQYLNELGAEVTACRDKGGCPSSELLHRLIHTLRGSARSVGLEKVADAYEALENLLNDLTARRINLNTEDISLLQSSHELGLRLLETLQQPAVPEENLLENFDQLTSAGQQRVIDLEQLAVEEAEVEEAPEPVVAEVEEDLDEELVEIFREEATDLLSRFHEALDAWREQPDSEEASSEIKRIFHTIKGGARSTGIMGVGNLAHNAETLLDDSEKAGNKIDERLFELIEEVHDTLLMMVDRPLSKEFAGQAKELDDRLTGYLSAVPEKTVRKGKAALSAKPEKKAEPVEEHAELALLDIERAAEEELPAAKLTEPKKASQNQIRVNADLLSTLANYAGEVSIARSRIQQMVTDFKDNLAELHNSIGRFQTQLRELEIQADTQILSTSGGDIEAVEDDFDPLEFDRYTQLQFLSRNLSEGLNDLMMIQNGMDNFAGDVEMLLAEQSRLNTDLQEGLTQTRMVAFSTLMPRLRQLTRKTARELDKPVNLTLKGGEVELDRNVIDQIVPPLEHLIRNSIAHGIESAGVRTKRDKSKKGNLSLIIRREGKDVIIEFGDDGRGLDLKKIQKKAIQNKLIEKGLKLSNDDLANLIFLSGFSTADNVSQVAGRGVGMDVVQSDIKQLGGSVSLTTEINGGTRFFIRLPLTLSVTQAMLVAAGTRQFAIPLISIQTITMAKTRNLITDSEGNRKLQIGRKEFPYMSLVERLGLVHHLEDEGKIPVLMLNTAAGQIAIGVDELLYATEIVVKPVGIQVASLDGVEGATIIGDGQVTLILDLVDLWHTRMVEHEDFDQASLVAELEQAEQSHATIMVVDDSLTVRRVTERNLSKYNVDTVLATDGVDAMEKLAEGDLPDVMLVDIEMPRMNGYEVTEAVRNDPHYKDIPIIIITSRSGAKHRNRAMELGATLYLTKPYQEKELMEAINAVLPADGSRKISILMEG